ncbi:hypothetical protein AVEN_153516-1 [Araneus ventricosus]|uniref:Uncharacterized protein n=1 Tax=Araneus ventricosus TaxID=182803 RepID=A0A4Y2WS74_ARAVE|nr:hypothetical protein AVEN_153516-1 [Araneus ventricosus]
MGARTSVDPQDFDVRAFTNISRERSSPPDFIPTSGGVTNFRQGLSNLLNTCMLTTGRGNKDFTQRVVRIVAGTPGDVVRKCKCS